MNRGDIMTNINDVKEAIKKEEFDSILGLIQPHTKLRLYLSDLKEKVSSLEEPKPIEEKPIRRRRSTAKKDTTE